ncbi:MAG: hypothetical protein JWM72_3453 [Actinomycetia bacterium]|jgi:hypothetical protein|nr:hypothetical protein [Actinomycetes bacterium]
MSSLKISSASSTLCSACAQRVEHRSNYAVATVTTETPDGMRTKLVANGTIVIHACVTSHAPATRPA